MANSQREARTSYVATFSRAASFVAHYAGHPGAFLIALAIVVVWAVSGPVFRFSDTWQLVINTGTTIVTFLMVFLIQNSQNRDGIAIQAKLDELLRAGPSKNIYIGIEHMTEEEIEELRAQCEAAAKDRSAAASRAEKAAHIAEKAAERAEQKAAESAD